MSDARVPRTDGVDGDACKARCRTEAAATPIHSAGMPDGTPSAPILPVIEARIMTMLIAGIQPRRIVVPLHQRRAFLEELKRSHSSRLSGQLPLQFMGVPYVFEEAELSVVSSV